MSLIEQAAKRLEELRRAGAETSGAASSSTSPERDPGARADRVPTPEAVVRGLGTRTPGLATPTMVTADRAEPSPERERDTSPAAPQPRIDIDLNRLKSLGIVSPDAPHSQIADEFRIIKRPILRNAFGKSGVKVKNGNLVMVTSALAGEGKTFTAVNLAMSVSMELDTTVLLVDGDVAQPDLPKLLGVPNSAGLLELLTRDDLDISDVLFRTNIEKLSVLPAGARHRRATELLASEQMAIVLRELVSRYPDRLIIFDSPPLLPTTESRVLATHMGQIVMVVAADSTRQHPVNLALATIESCEIVLMMLNKADKTDVGSYYGYYANDPPR